MSAALLHRRPLAARLFALASAVAAALAAWPNRLVPPPFRLLQIGSAFWQSRALYVAARLDVAGALGDAALPVTALARQVGADAGALARLLRLLAAAGVFEETQAGVYANNKLSNALREDRPDCVRAMVLMHNAPEMSRPWFEQLEAGVRHGAVPFRLCHGADLYEHMDGHPDFEALFGRAMAQVEALSGDGFASGFDWGRFQRLVDIGGSQGAKSLAILKRHPGLQALVVDRPRAIAGAAERWAARPDTAEAARRLQFEPGDLFGPLPELRRGDVLLLSAVLHGCSDAQAERALRRLARAAAPVQAPIVLLEMVMPAQRADLASAAFDLQMFMGTDGRERTLDEWQALCAASGVALAELVSLPSFGKLLLLRP